MTTSGPPALIALYRRAMVCERFPAYKIEELTDVKARPLLQAIELMSLVAQAQSKR